VRKLAILFIFFGALAGIGWNLGWDLPTLSWFYDSSESFGYLCSAVSVVIGVLMLTSKKNFAFKPMTLRRIERFKSIKRGYYSLLVILALILFAALDQLVVGKRALLVKYNGEWCSPALMQETLKNKESRG